MKKPLIVQKFGGTSVGSIERIQIVAEHVIREKRAGNQVVVVVSAMAGETNRLMALAKQINSVPTARELDVLLSSGEQVSIALLAMMLNTLGYSASSLTGAQAGIMTDHQYNTAAIKHIDTTAIKELLEQDRIVVVAGFQGINSDGDITTLGRGGSDTTAVALAGALDANECQIFTDVDGIYTCDPRIVKQAEKIEVIDFPSMEEMASKGAKVLHLPSVQFAWKHQVPLRVLSTFDINAGSLVKGEQCTKSICGLAIQKEWVMLSLNIEQVPSLLMQCQMLGIEVYQMNPSEQDTCVVIHHDGYTKLAQVAAHVCEQYELVSLLTIIGYQAHKVCDSAQQLLREQGITVHQYCYSERSLMLVMLPECVDKAANILHDAYITSGEELEFQQKQAFSR